MDNLNPQSQNYATKLEWWIRVVFDSYKSNDIESMEKEIEKLKCTVGNLESAQAGQEELKRRIKALENKTRT
jgi:polyhydroxyalkanoate synthesis regulator phasin